MSEPKIRLAQIAPSASGTDSITGNVIISQNLTVGGNLTVSGNTTVLNVETLLIEDNDIVLNSNTVGSPTLNSSITVNRGSSTNTFLRWNEGTDSWGWSDNGTTFNAFEDLVKVSGDTMTGNLGLGATPAAWSGRTAVQVQNAFVAGVSTAAVFGTNNYYDNSVDRYIATGPAQSLVMDSGGFKFLLAPSGNAGDTISFTQAMTLNQSGNLGIGTTNPSKLLDINGVMNAVHHEINGKRIFHIFVGGAGIGYGGQTTAAAVFVNGMNVFSCSRSWGLVAISTSNGDILHAQTYDVYVSSAEATNFLNALSTYYTNNNIICINTFDEPETNSASIRTALVDEYGLKDANMPTNQRYAYCAIIRHGFGRIAECHSAYWSGSTLTASGANNNRSRASCTATVVA